MTTGQEATGWLGFEVVRRLDGHPVDDEQDIRKRVEATLGTIQPDPRNTAGIWAPTPFGDVLASSLISLMVRAAPAGDGLAAYKACEDEGALDRLMDTVQRAVIRELRKVAGA